MEQWETDGFASKEAWERNQQTVKEEKDKLQHQIDEKQKIIDSDRTKISDLSTAEKELKELKEQKDKDEAKRLEDEEKAKALKTPEALNKANEERIAKLPKEKRDEEQKKLLSSPEGMEAFLDIKCNGKIDPDNPFDITPKPKSLTIAEQVAKAFGKADKNNPDIPQRSKSGFDPEHLSEPVKKQRERFDDKMDVTKNKFF